MALRVVKDMLPWIAPSVAIAFAVYVFIDGEAARQTSDVTATTAASQPLTPPEDATEIVARQATPESDLIAVTAKPARAQPVVEIVSKPEREPEPQPVREAALLAPPAILSSPSVDVAADRQCIEDLRMMAAEARVYFPSGGVTADAAGIEQGRLLGMIAEKCPGVQIRVDGHSDPSGDSAANQILSERRAREVIQRIGAGGLDTSKFFARGMGDRQPSGRVGPEPDAYYDRRVEFSVVEEVTRVAVRAPVTTSSASAARDTCVADLQRAAERTLLFYAPRSVSLRPADLDTAMTLARMAEACPAARLRVIGQFADSAHSGEDAATARLRAKALMAMLVGRGIPAEQIIIAAPSRPMAAVDAAGQPGSRVVFDTIAEDG